MSSVQGASFGERNFKYLLVGPAIFVLLLIGVFPLVYLLTVSFQGITMTETSTDFIGAANYKQLFDDARLWQALLHTLIITAIALPLELVLGLTMAQLFLDRLPGRAIFIALLVLPVVVSPIVSGATWALLFNHRFGPINQIIGWIAGKVGYALPPGGHPELALGFALSVASSSKNKEAAYLFIQWLNSEEISTKRVQLPYTLRDPFRDSHYTDPVYLGLWPDAKDYLAALKAGSQTGLLDLSLIQTDRYEEALRQGISRLWAGEDPKKILDDVAKQWDDTTAKIGLEKQKAVYNAWAAKSGAYPK